MARPYPHKIVFLRHGRTSYNAESRLQRQRDIPLDGMGREQARAIGRFLGEHWGGEMARLEARGAYWSSPLRRARETMELARGAMKLSPGSYRCDPRLKELSFGDWEGLTWGEIEAKYPDAGRDREADKWAHTPPNGESYAALSERLRGWLEEREAETLVVAHGGVARALMALLAGAPPSRAANAEIPQGRVLIFDKGAYSWIG